MAFSRTVSQGLSEGIGNFFVDQLEFKNKDLPSTTTKTSTITTSTITWNSIPVKQPFTCSFDKFSLEDTNSCNGISYTATNNARISSFEVDQLDGTSHLITDFTSIGK